MHNHTHLHWKISQIRTPRQKNQECPIWNNLILTVGFHMSLGPKQPLMPILPAPVAEEHLLMQVTRLKEERFKEHLLLRFSQCSICVCTINIKPWGKKVDELCLWDNIRCYIHDIMWKKTLEMSPDRTAETRQSALHLFWNLKVWKTN